MEGESAAIIYTQYLCLPSPIYFALCRNGHPFQTHNQVAPKRQARRVGEELLPEALMHRQSERSEWSCKAVEVARDGARELRITILTSNGSKDIYAYACIRQRIKSQYCVLDTWYIGVIHASFRRTTSLRIRYLVYHGQKHTSG